MAEKMESNPEMIIPGRIVRAVAGFFYVEPLDGSSGLVECTLRGKLKISPEGVLVGDKVEYQLIGGQGVISRILPRETILKRPYIANVDLILLVFAHQNPDPNEYLITKFTVLAEASGIPYILIFNKTDLAGKGKAQSLANQYQDYGFRVVCTSVVTHLGKRTLQKALSEKVAVVAGPSGVGKSALINMIAPGFQLQTGLLSSKIGRGKHTTREVQLLRINPCTYIADTPGFTQISMDFLEPGQLADYFPDLAIHRGQCKFKTCVHHAEPDCSVKLAVSEGKIRPERYETYVELLNEVRTLWASRYR